MSLQKTRLLFLSSTSLVALLPSFPATAEGPPSPSEQIATALAAAPESQRQGAEVIGYAADGSETVLREGKGELICLADNPTKEGFESDCYHRSLAPFMARGRDLRRQGVSSSGQRNSIRWKEMKAGALATPEQSATLHILVGKSFDPATGTVEEPYRRWVIYVPYATAKTTGMPIESNGADPWLMAPGTPSAHFMITPARPKSRG